MELELLKAIPNGGTLVVFVVVVVLFLKQIAAQNEINRALQADVQKRIDSVAQAFSTQITAITTNFQAQIQSLTDGVLRSSTESSKSMTDLASAVRELQGKIDTHKRD